MADRKGKDKGRRKPVAETGELETAAKPVPSLIPEVSEEMVLFMMQVLEGLPKKVIWHLHKGGKGILKHLSKKDRMRRQLKKFMKRAAALEQATAKPAEGGSTDA